MNVPTNDAVHIIKDEAGQPILAILPFAHYQALVETKTEIELGIPSEVVENVVCHDQSPTRAWRLHLQLTQTEVARRMRITQGAYAQLEARKTIRPSSRIKVAKALNIDESQLDF